MLKKKVATFISHIPLYCNATITSYMYSMMSTKDCQKQITRSFLQVDTVCNNIAIQISIYHSQISC